VVIARNPEKPSTSFNYPDYRYLRDHNKSFSGVIATGEGSATAFAVPGENGAAEVIPTARVSGNYFDVLGVPAAIGRLFTEQDNATEGAHPLVILSYDLWQRRFAGNQNVLGRKVTLNGTPFTIVGVTARGFHGISVGNHSDLYVPIVMMPTLNPPARGWNTRHWWWLNVMARLKPGATMQAASSEMNVLQQQILKADPEYKPPPAYEKVSATRDQMVVLPGSTGWSYFRTQFSKPLTVLMIVVGLVLLIACANVANLLLARAAGRQKEIAVRLAVGASRTLLVRQLLAESVVLSLAGGGLGVLFAWWTGSALLGVMANAGETPLTASPDLRVLAFTFALSLITGIVFGLVPAWQATSPKLAVTLKDQANHVSGGVGHVRLRKILVVTQVSLSRVTETPPPP